MKRLQRRKKKLQAITFQKFQKKLGFQRKRNEIDLNILLLNSNPLLPFQRQLKRKRLMKKNLMRKLARFKIRGKSQIQFITNFMLLALKIGKEKRITKALKLRKVLNNAPSPQMFIQRKKKRGNKQTINLMNQPMNVCSRKISRQESLTEGLKIKLNLKKIRKS